MKKSKSSKSKRDEKKDDNDNDNEQSIHLSHSSSSPTNSLSPSQNDDDEEEEKKPSSCTEERFTAWLGGNGKNNKQESILSCSSTVKQPFAPPQRRNEKRSTLDTTTMATSMVNGNEMMCGNDIDSKRLDMEGWIAMYEKPFHKELEIKPRNRIHEEMIETAEEVKDKEKPQLPVTSVQNALIFKRMAARRQLLGGLI